MATLNKVLIIGNLTRDPEGRATQGGTNIANFSMAVNEPRSANSEKEPEVSYIDCVAFGKTADLIMKHVTKGSPVLVEGRLRQNRWEQEGQKRSKIEIIVFNIQFLGRKKDGEGSSSGATHGHDSYPDPGMGMPESDIPF